MASERDEARAAIGESSDVDVSGPMDAATRLKFIVENNKQSRRMAAGERGFLGYLIGGKDHAPIVISFLAMLLGLGIGTWALYQGAIQAADHDFWAKQADRAFIFATSALGYLFGRSTK